MHEILDLLQEASVAVPLFSPVIVPMAQSFGPVLSQLTSSPTFRLGVSIYISSFYTLSVIIFSWTNLVLVVCLVLLLLFGVCQMIVLVACLFSFCLFVFFSNLVSSLKRESIVVLEGIYACSLVFACVYNISDITKFVKVIL